MPRGVLPHLLLLLGLSAPCLSAPWSVAAQPRQALVLSIGDGDTIRVRQGGRAITVRLACIDAPEMAQQPHGQKARDYLRMRLPIGSAVSLDVKATDRYGRTVAEVISQINIGLALVEDGQAFAYRQHLSGCDAKEYLDAEYRASRRRHGFWQVSGGITRPWDFRRSPRGRSIPDGATPIWTEMAMVRPVQACAGSTQPIGTPSAGWSSAVSDRSSHRQTITKQHPFPACWRGTPAVPAVEAISS